MGVADDDAGAEDYAGKRGEAGSDHGFSLGLGLLVGVAVGLADGQFLFADKALALAGHVGGADVGEAAEVGSGGGEVEDAAGAFDVDGAGFVERMVKADGGGGVDDAGDLVGEGLVVVWAEAAVGEADVAGIGADAVAVGGRDEGVGAGLNWLIGAGADEEGERGVGLAGEEFADQAGAEKAGCAGNQDELFVYHAENRPQC